MCCYGWTIDYINDFVTIPQIFLLMDEIKRNPPTAVVTFAFGEKEIENTMKGNLADFGDKVTTTRFMDDSIKSVIRKRDGLRIK
jgi:hypothetical protein